MSKPERLPREGRRQPTAEEVLAYLERHPDFLQNNPDLLAVLTPPRHKNGRNVVDMQHYMIERLQADMDGLLEDHADLVALNRRNQSGQARVQEAILDVLNARTFEQFIETITTDLAIKLDVDIVRLAVENENADGPHTRAGVRLLPSGTVDDLLGSDQDILLRAAAAGEREIYGAGATLVASDAIMRLKISPMAPTGLLALGSRDVGRFTPGQDTELLGFLAKVLECTARSWLDLPG